LNILGFCWGDILSDCIILERGADEYVNRLIRPYFTVNFLSMGVIYEGVKRSWNNFKSKSWKCLNGLKASEVYGGL